MPQLTRRWRFGEGWSNFPPQNLSSWVGKTAQYALELFWLEPPRSLFSGIGDLAFSINDEDALRPACIQIVHGVVDCVDNARHRELEPLATLSGHGLTFGRIRGLVKDNILRFVGLRLPAVGWVSLLDVHEEERGAIPVLLIQCFEVAGPATERRSGKAAEDENQRTMRLVHASGDGLRAVESWQSEVGRGLPHGGDRASH